MMFEYNGKNIYIEKAVAEGLNRRIEHNKQFWDSVYLCVGKEGVAKSSLMRQWGAYISKKQNLPFSVKDNIHFNVDDYIKACEKSPPGTVHILDEARRDLLKSKSTSKSNVKFNNFLSECRNLQLHHIIILPQFSDIDRYLARARTHVIVSVGTIKDEKTGIEERGYYKIIKTASTKRLMKVYEDKYSRFPQYLILLRGKFSNVDPLDTKEYEQKKKQERIKKFTELETQNNVNFGDKELHFMEECLIEGRKGYKSNTNEYKAIQRALNKVKSLKKTTSETSPLLNYNKGGMK